MAYWQVNKYPASSPKKDDAGYDAISGATVAKANFTVPFSVAADFPRQFHLYFETDYSFNSNDWFSEQPSVVYRASVDLDSTANSFPATLLGWAASEDIPSMQSSYIDPMPGHGELETETRYITHTRENDGSFGTVDPSTAIVTKMVGSIVVNRVE